MSTQVGVGVSTNKNEKTAGNEAARQALQKMGGPKADFVLVFATTGYDQQRLAEDLRDKMGRGEIGATLVVRSEAYESKRFHTSLLTDT